MKSLYITTSGDTTLELPIPIDVDGLSLWNYCTEWKTIDI